MTWGSTKSSLFMNDSSHELLFRGIGFIYFFLRMSGHGLRMKQQGTALQMHHKSQPITDVDINVDV